MSPDGAKAMDKEVKAEGALKQRAGVLEKRGHSVRLFVYCPLRAIRLTLPRLLAVPLAG